MIQLIHSWGLFSSCNCPLWFPDCRTLPRELAMECH